MQVRHINCGTMFPLMNHWIHGTGSFWNRPPLVTHCLLVETIEGLLLVDTGFGRQDFINPSTSVRIFMTISNYHLASLTGGIYFTAYEQVKRLGYQPDDVRHIAVTHMHLDHVGGLSDFPNASVHIYDKEYEGIINPETLEEKYICRREHWAHGPDWHIHNLRGDRWFGFDATPLFQIGDTSLGFIPLSGHTRGHSAVVIRTREGWLMHCGDAYVYYGDVDPLGPHYPSRHKLALDIMGYLSYAFRFLGTHSHNLRNLLREHGDEVQIFCSHDPYEFSKYCPKYPYKLDGRRPNA
jgi:glyoxylase-like metal-dependent hydrolase (beta-lactamase superfamily II)